MRFTVLLVLFALVSVALARIPVGADTSATNVGGPMTRQSDSSSSKSHSTKYVVLDSHRRSGHQSSSKKSSKGGASPTKSSSSSKSSKSSQTGGPGDQQSRGTSNTGIPAQSTSSLSELVSSQVSSAKSDASAMPSAGDSDSQNGAMDMAPGLLATMLLASSATLLLYMA